MGAWGLVVAGAVGGISPIIPLEFIVEKTCRCSGKLTLKIFSR
jgi:hypothetical protein